MVAIVKSGYRLVDQAMNYGNEIRESLPATEMTIRFAGFAALAFSRTDLSIKLVNNADFLCSMYLFQSINLWVNGGWRKGGLIPRLANAVFTGAIASCFVYQLDQWKFIDLSQLAASIGSKVPLLQPLTSMSSMVFFRGQLALAFALLDVHQLWNGYENWCAKRESETEIARINTPQLRAKLDLAALNLNQNLIDVAQLTAQTALNVLCLCGYATALPVIIGFGLSYGSAVLNFLNKASQKQMIEDLNNRIKPFHLNPDSIPLYSSPQLSLSHWIDFAGRVVSKFEGLDTFCQFGISGIDGYDKFWDNPSTSFVLAKESLEANVSWNKFTNLVPSTQKVMKQICEGKANFKETLHSTCLLAVALFESYAWVAGKSMSSAFQAWKNGFFVTGLAAGITKDSYDLDKWDQKNAASAGRINYWGSHPLRNCTGTDQIRDYYAGKMARETDPAKINKWQGRINRINSLQPKEHLAYVDDYEKHLTKKSDDWSEIQKFAEVSKIAAEKFRMCSFIKMISLGVDLGVITLTVKQDRVRQVLAAVNLFHGAYSLYAFHYNEYQVEERKALLINERHIKPVKLEVERQMQKRFAPI